MKSEGLSPHFAKMYVATMHAGMPSMYDTVTIV